MERATEEGRLGNYFLQPKPLKFIHTGCTLLNCVIGGGWPLGRISNIKGDTSTGKSLLAIEACVNFARQYPQGKIFYREIESAFDTSYAAFLGMPLDRVDFGDGFFTVEDVYEDISKILKDEAKAESGLYIIDSLDALSDRAELERDIDKGTFSANKPK